jgi:membrane associated rhomboid family serine protease
LIPLRDVNPTRITPIVTLALIGVNLVVFFLIQGRGTPEDQQALVYERAAIACEVTTGYPLGIDEILNDTCVAGAQDPVFPDKNVFLALLTSMFLHGSVGHVLFNMWFLWIFGNNVEEAYGHLGYLLIYLIGGLAATAAYVGLNPEATVPLVGASGAVAVTMGASSPAIVSCPWSAGFCSPFRRRSSWSSGSPPSSVWAALARPGRHTSAASSSGPGSVSSFAPH